MYGVCVFVCACVSQSVSPRSTYLCFVDLGDGLVVLGCHSELAHVCVDLYGLQQTGHGLCRQWETQTKVLKNIATVCKDTGTDTVN